ncbi:glycosyltransferase family 4 protein [Rhodoferax sp.]|uniref:glycosyltransferase family 4 protein n=1 Tax=Rhodoferax sp. TaxID=50421 RepID=UPI0025D12B68|nr:glycosyltransferase family 4 protein [Rhodoferax sp.]
MVESKRLLIVVNVDWFFLSHRLPVALAALEAGYEVHVATLLTQGRARLQAYGFIVHELQIERSSSGAWSLLKLFVAFMRLLWLVRPDVLHLVTIKPVLIGGLAARLSPVKGVVYAISGLGHVFVEEGWSYCIRRWCIGIWYRFALGARNKRIIFQNSDDRSVIEASIRLRDAQINLIPGSGVDLTHYRYSALPEGEAVVLMAARLLGTKGVREFVAAAQILRSQGYAARFWLFGDIDTGNPASIEAGEIESWKQQGVVEVLGHSTDIAAIMAKVQVVVLPSYREGLPKVLIEAAACGRAVVTTDVPGCRDAIEAGVTGLLVPPKDAYRLVEAIRQLLENRAKCEAMGQAGRKRAEQIFNVTNVVTAHLALYRALGAVR